MTAYNHAEFSLTQKRAEITDEERRLIDEAVAAGNVQKIPTGKSAFDQEYIWGTTSRGSEGLMLKDPMSRQEALAKFKAQNRRPRTFKANPAEAHRRAEVLRLTKEGHSAVAISEALKAVGIHCAPSTVKRDRDQLKAAGKLSAQECGTPGKTKEDIANRRERVLELITAGKSNQQVADELGETIGSIQSDRSILIQEGRLKRAVGGRL